MKCLYRCVGCKREFPRKDVVLPALGTYSRATRCKPCHADHVMGFRASCAARLPGKPRINL